MVVLESRSFDRKPFEYLLVLVVRHGNFVFLSNGCARSSRCCDADATKMNNNNGHDQLGEESGGGGQYGSSTSIKQRLGQPSSRTSSGQHKSGARPATVTALAMVTAAPPTSPQQPTTIRSLEGRRYRDILRQESLSASKENINGAVPSSKV